MNDLVLYTTEDGRSQIKLRVKDETVWLTQLEMAELFDAINTPKKRLMQQLFPSPEVVEL